MTVDQWGEYRCLDCLELSELSAWLCVIARRGCAMRR
jgi:hypothetical protein